MLKETEFKEYLQSEKGSSKSTSQAYASDVKEFDVYLTTKGKNLQSADRENVKAFIEHLASEGRTGSSINRKLVSLRKYYDYLKDLGLVSYVPTERVKAPKPTHRELEYLSIEEIEKILALPDDSVKGLRDKALLELMYACGLKVSEACDAKLKDVDLRIGFISVRASNNKMRIIPIGKPARAAILKYLSDSRPALLKEKEDCGKLFLNYAGENVTRQGVWKIIKYYGEQAGIKGELSPQIIRNSFAAHLIFNGADLKSLQELMGTEDAAATKLFLALSSSRVMDVYDRTHPRA